MYVAASEDLDDLFDIVQRVRAQAAVEGGPAGPHDDCDLGKDVEQMEVDAEVDLIPTTVLEVETKRQKRVKVSKVRMIHTFRADSIIKRQQVTGVMTHMCSRVCKCVIHIRWSQDLIDINFSVTKYFAMFRCSTEFIHSILMGGRAEA